MAQGRAAAPRQEHVHNHLLRADSLTLQENKCCKVPTSTTLSSTLMAPACLGQPPTLRAGEEGQQYSRQGSLAGDDAVGPVPFVHQPCVGLHPHPAAPLGQQPEHRQPALPRLHHWGRDTRELAQTEFLRRGRQITRARLSITSCPCYGGGRCTVLCLCQLSELIREEEPLSQLLQPWDTQHQGATVQPGQSLEGPHKHPPQQPPALTSHVVLCTVHHVGRVHKLVSGPPPAQLHLRVSQDNLPPGISTGTQ